MFCIEAGNHLKHYCCHLIVESISEQINLKNKKLIFFVQTYRKTKDNPIWKCHVTMTKKGKNLFIWKSHVTMTKKDKYINKEMQLQNLFLTFNPKNKTILSASSILFRSPVAHITTDFLDKLTFTNYLDLGKCPDRF